MEIDASKGIIGGDNVGGLVGFQLSNTDNVNNKIENCYVTAGNVGPAVIISGGSNVGGLVGYQRSHRLNGTPCSNVIENCYATSNVSGASRVGGLVGYQYSSNIGTSRIAYSYSTGNVNGASAGGLVGSQAGFNSLIVGSHRYEDVRLDGVIVLPGNPDSQPNKKHGGAKTAVELKTKSTYTANNWLFNDSIPTAGPWIWDKSAFPKLIAGTAKFPFPFAPAPVITFSVQPAANTSVVAGNITGSLSVLASAVPYAWVNYQWFSNTTNSNEGGTAVSGATSASFTIPTTLAFGTYYYYCVASAAGAESEPSNTAIVAVTPQPVITITTHPQPLTTVTEGSITGSLTTAAEVTQDRTLLYQWYSNTSNSEAGAVQVSGATSATFNIPTSLSDGSYYYFCHVSAAGAVPVNSSIARVTVTAKPIISITTNLQSITVVEGNIDHSLTIAASVFPTRTLTYQWYENSEYNGTTGTLIPGATGTTYAIPATLAAKTTPHYFYCVVSAQYADSVTSHVAGVTVTARPVITINIQPQNVTVMEGSITAADYLDIDAAVSEGKTVTYQWYSTASSTPIPGAVTRYLSIPIALAAGTYQYYCVLGDTLNQAVPVTSNAATVTVTPQPVITIYNHPQSASYVYGSVNGSLSVTANATHGATLGYQWHYNTVNDYAGAVPTTAPGTSATFVIPSAAAVGDHYYFCHVYAAGAVAINTTIAKVTITPKPVINIHTPAQSLFLVAGNINHSFTISATVDPDRTLTYQWYENTSYNNAGGTAIIGANSATFIVPDTLEPGSYYYYCVVSAQDAVPATSNMCTVAVTTQPAITISPQPQNKTVTEGSISGILAIGASVNPWSPHSYQWYKNTIDSNVGGILIPGETNDYFFIPQDLSAENYYYYCVVSAPLAASVPSNVATVTVTPKPVISITGQPQSVSVVEGIIAGNLTIDASVTEDRTLYYQWFRTWSGNYDGNTLNAINGAQTKTFTIPTHLTEAESPVYYYCLVNALDASPVFSSIVTVTVTKRPVITINANPQPDNYVVAGNITGNLTIGASVSEGATLNYQWYKTETYSAAGSPIPGETSANFTIPTTLSAGTHYYYCVLDAQNAVTVVSNVGTVHVFTQPVITITAQAQSVSFIKGSISGNLLVVADVTEYRPLNCQWYSNTIDSNSGGTLIPGALSLAYTIPTDLDVGNYYYYCVLEADDAVTVTSNVATVTVTPKPEITILTQPQDVTVTEGSISGSLTIFVNVTEGRTPSYQWYYNTTGSNSAGTHLGSQYGANTSTLTIPAHLTRALAPHYFFCAVNAPEADTVHSRAVEVIVVEAPVIQTGPLPNGTVGVNYHIIFSATGSDPKNWSITGGALPAGLSLNGDTGDLIGTPTAEGTFTFTVKAANIAGSDETDRSIVIDPAPTFGISLSPGVDYVFDPAVQYYPNQPAYNVTITNTGNQPTGALTIATSANSYMLNKTASGIVVGGTDTFAVAPIAGLTPGTYTSAISVTGANGISRSFNVSFTVLEKSEITITGHPQSFEIFEGETENLTVTASVFPSTETLSYQWYFTMTGNNTGGFPVPGATSPTYAIPTDYAVGTHRFYCEVNASGGAVTKPSNVATVTVKAAIPKITFSIQPASNTAVTEGSITGSLSAQAVSDIPSLISYQWYRSMTGNYSDGTSLGTANGANTNIYTIPTNLTADTYYVYCVASGTGGAVSVNSNIATVTVTAATTYTISASVPAAFGSLQTPYTQPAAQTVTITNTGTGSVTLTPPTAANYYIGGLSTTTLAANGATATFTVQPKEDLAAGVYNETITVNGNNGASTTFPVSFEVTAAQTYTVTFVDWDSTVIGTPQTVPHGADATAPANPERLGYTFLNWDKAFTNVTGNLTVTAVYVPTTNLSVNNFAGLKNAINNAPESIQVNINVTGNIALTESITIPNNKEIVIKSNGGKFILTVASGLRHFIVNANANFTLTNVILDGGYTGSGTVTRGGIDNFGSLNIDGVEIRYCYASEGGGIYNAGAADIIDSKITGNTANLGGGIYNDGGAYVDILGGEISNNKANQNGGGVFAVDLTKVEATGTVFSGNTASQARWMTDAADVATHIGLIKGITQFSVPPAGNKPFDYAYNNYDISYAKGLTSNPLSTQPTLVQFEKLIKAGPGAGVFTEIQSTIQGSAPNFTIALTGTTNLNSNGLQRPVEVKISGITGQAIYIANVNNLGVEQNKVRMIEKTPGSDIYMPQTLVNYSWPAGLITYTYKLNFYADAVQIGSITATVTR